MLLICFYHRNKNIQQQLLNSTRYYASIYKLFCFGSPTRRTHIYVYALHIKQTVVFKFFNIKQMYNSSNVSQVPGIMLYVLQTLVLGDTFVLPVINITRGHT